MRALAAVLLLFAAQVAFADDPRVASLAEHALRIRSIDPADDDFADLEPLRATLAGARVVLLGEQSHGDGSAFLAKTRLVRFLHERMGFEVLAFESGIYDCAKAWELLRGGEPARTAVPRGVFRIWTASREVQPLIDYLGKRAKSDRPLEMAGVDLQFSGSASHDFFLDDLAAFVGSDSAKGREWDRVAYVVRHLTESSWELDKEPMPSSKEQAAFKRTIEKWRDRAPPGSHWRQVLTSLRTLAELTWRNPQDVSAFALRDRQMGENLVWLAKERYPNRKIVVWAATFHNARELHTIVTADPKARRLYQGTSAMGEVAFRALGSELYSLGFTSYEGESATAFERNARKLSRPSVGSLEDLFARAGLDLALVDFRKGPPWLRNPITARLLGHTEMRADWTRVVDGVFFIRNLSPSRRL